MKDFKQTGFKFCIVLLILFLSMSTYSAQSSLNITDESVFNDDINIEENSDENTTVPSGKIINQRTNEDYTNLTIAIEECADHDTLLLDPGTYNMDIEIPNRPLTLKGADAKKTTLQVQEKQFCTILDTENVILEGLTFTRTDQQNSSTIQILHSNVTIKNCIFTKNHGENGGAIDISEQSQVKITNCTFTKNTALHQGGAIQNQATCNLKIQNCIFTENEAKFGGSIVNFNQLTLENTQFKQNKVSFDGGAIDSKTNTTNTIINCNFTENKAQHYGGAFQNKDNSITTMSDCLFTKNYVWRFNGGAINNWENSQLNCTKCTFNNNNAMSPEQEGGGRGGAIQNDASTLTLDQCTLDNNEAQCFGGAIANYDKLILKNTKFNKNRAIDHDGGAIWNTNLKPLTPESTIQQVNISDCEFTDNTANYGGAIVNEKKGLIDIYKCQFKHNSAKGDGGAITNWQKSSIDITLTDFSENYADNSGAVNCDSATMKMHHSHLTKNQARNNGGAIGLNKGSDVNSETNIYKENQAAGYGGVIYSSGLLTVNNDIFEKNKANKEGGAFWLDKGDRDVICQSIFRENEDNGAGGAIYSLSEDMDVSSSVIVNNNIKCSNNLQEVFVHNKVKMENNWWGTNNKPTNKQINMDVNKWVVLKLTTPRTIIGQNQTIPLNVDLNYNNEGEKLLKPLNDDITVFWTATAGQINSKSYLKSGASEEFFKAGEKEETVRITAQIHNAKQTIQIQIQALKGWL